MLAIRFWLMRCEEMGFCEEKGTGVDKVIAQYEASQLLTPDFRINNNQTITIMDAHLTLNDRNRKDKIRATYQHCCLMFVTNQKMTNQTLRARFKIAEQNAIVASLIIKDALKKNLIKPEDPDSKSRKFVNYIPYWA